MIAHEADILGFLDLETSGVEENHHEIVEIALQPTDVYGEEIAKPFVRKIKIKYPERMTEDARQWNGYDEAVWAEEAVGRYEGLMQLIEYVDALDLEKPMLLVAQNCHFDASFLDHWFWEFQWKTGVGRRDISHRNVLDIPSMAWGNYVFRTKGAVLCELYDVEREPKPHIALNGVQQNIRLYRAILAANASYCK